MIKTTVKGLKYHNQGDLISFVFQGQMVVGVLTSFNLYSDDGATLYVNVNGTSDRVYPLPALTPVNLWSRTKSEEYKANIYVTNSINANTVTGFYKAPKKHHTIREAIGKTKMAQEIIDVIYPPSIGDIVDENRTQTIYLPVKDIKRDENDRLWVSRWVKNSITPRRENERQVKLDFDNGHRTVTLAPEQVNDTSSLELSFIVSRDCFVPIHDIEFAPIPKIIKIAWA